MPVSKKKPINNRILESLLLAIPVDEEELLKVTRPMITGIIAKRGWWQWQEDLEQIGAMKILEIARDRKFNPRQGRAFSLLNFSLTNAFLNHIKKFERDYYNEHDFIANLIDSKERELICSPAYNNEIGRRLEEISKELSDIELDISSMILADMNERTIAQEISSHFEIEISEAIRRIRHTRIKIRIGLLDCIESPSLKGFCKRFEAFTSGHSLEYLADILSPGTLYKFIRIFGGMKINVPKIQDIMSHKSKV